MHERSHSERLPCPFLFLCSSSVVLVAPGVSAGNTIQRIPETSLKCPTSTPTLAYMLPSAVPRVSWSRSCHTRRKGRAGAKGQNKKQRGWQKCQGREQKRNNKGKKSRKEGREERTRDNKRGERKKKRKERDSEREGAKKSLEKNRGAKKQCEDQTNK